MPVTKMTVLAVCLFCFSIPAYAEFLISSAIIEFNETSGNQQDIEIVSRGQESDYIVTEAYEVLNPGLPNETRKLIEDASEGGLLVTPDKTVLPPGARKVMRFVLLAERSDKERIYRVDVKPVIRGVKNDSRIGLKVLVGYQALVIVRPTTIRKEFTIKRAGKRLEITNKGNSNLLLQSGEQCPADKSKCASLPVMRIYADETAHIDLPMDAPLTYSIWNGVETIDKKVD